MKLSPLFAALKDHVDKLHALLAEPEPGLMTWSMFLGEHWKAVVGLWHEGIPEKEEK
jgi:hypothetical protein